MKRIKPLLWVKAVPQANVREIDEYGRPLNVGICRFVGKAYDSTVDHFQVLEEGVKVPYHSNYIARLKEEALLPMDVATSVLAGVKYTQ